MPSKPLMVVLILVAAGVFYASLEIDRTRDVPSLPPQFATMATGGSMGGGAPAPENPGDAGMPGTPEDGGADANDSKGTETSGDEIRIDTVALQGVESQATELVKRGEDDAAVVLTIGKEGELRWAGFAVGSYGMLEKMMRDNASREGFRLVIAPDENVPWQYVQWALRIARDEKVGDVSLGCYPTTDPKGTLLARINADVMAGEPTEALPDTMDPIPVKVMMDDEDNVVYILMGEACEGPSALYQKAGPMNSEYASFYTADYARKAAGTPWSIQPEKDIPAGKVLRAVGALRMTSVYAVRFEGDYGTPPGMKK